MDDRTALELQILKDTVIKLEKQISDLKYETVTLTSKYLEGFNNILEGQSDSRTNDKNTNNEITSLKEKIIILEATVDKLQQIDAYSEIKRFMEHIKNEKEITDFITITRDFITSTNTNMKMLIAAASAISIVLLGMLIQIVTKMVGGN